MKTEQTGKLIALGGLVLALLGLAAHQIVYAQTTETTVNTALIDSFAGMLIAIGGVLGSVGVILGYMVPWIKKINEKAAARTAKVADSLVESDHWSNEIATQVKQNEAKADVAWQALEALAHLSPEAQAKVDAAKIALQEKFTQIQAEAEKDKAELDRLHAALPTSTNTQTT